MIYKTTLQFLFLPALLCAILYSCGNTNIKENSINQDSLKAQEDWNKTIPGNFSHQKIFYFDSIEISEFIKKHPSFSSLDSNINQFYSKRKYSFAWFDDKGLIEQAGNLIDRVSNLKEEGLFTEPKYKMR